MNSDLLLIPILFTASVFLSCSNNKTSQEIYVMLDQTELYFNHLTIDQIKDFSTLKKDVDRGEIIHVQGITELRRTDKATISIPYYNSILGNEIKRKNYVDNYFSQIDSVLQTMKSRKNRRNGSSILIPLFENLNMLSGSLALSRKLIINSDLDDNMLPVNSSQNLYDLIRIEPDKARFTIMNKIPLNDLSGIEIIIFYLPQSKIDDEKFEILSSFYKEIFESRGAKVKIAGTI